MFFFETPFEKEFDFYVTVDEYEDGFDVSEVLIGPIKGQYVDIKDLLSERELRELEELAVEAKND